MDGRVVMIWCQLLLWSLPFGLACTPERLPTFGDLTSITAQDVKPPQINRQWIFPSLRFTCSLNVTGWVFRTATNQVEPNTKCPTLGLWRDNDITPSNTADYVRRISLSEFREPERIAPFVFRCNLDTPLLVHTGSILGFSSKVPATGNVMQVQFTEQAGTVGYHRNVGLGILFNTALTSIVHVDEASGVVPLITPLDGSEKEDLTTLIPSPSASASTLLPNPSSFPPVWNGREGSGTSATAVLVVVPLCIVILLVLAIAGLVFAAIFFRQRRAPSITKQADGQPQGDLESSTAKLEQGLEVTTNHDYEDVDKMALDLSKKHDYDVVNCGTPLVWSPNGYEIPFTQTMAHGVSMAHGISKQPIISTSVYEPPGKCTDLYEVPTATRGILRGGIQVADRGYDTPIDAQNGTHRANDDNYETMWVDNYSSQSRIGAVMKGFKVGQLRAASPTQHRPGTTAPSTLHDKTHNVINSRVFMQSFIHQEESL